MKADDIANHLIPSGGILDEKQVENFIKLAVEGVKDGTYKPADIDRVASRLTDADFTGRCAGYMLAARLPGLSQRKYYGTPVYIFWKRGGGDMVASYEFSLWLSTGTPSDRWLAGYDITRKQYDDNARIFASDDPRDWDYARSIICDCHYESDLTLAMARALTDAINGMNKERK